MVTQRGPEEGCKHRSSKHTGMPYAPGHTVVGLAEPKAAPPDSMPDHQSGWAEQALHAKLLNKA